ncbi:MAG TPA: hypothetical protein VFG69_06150, partial [Nannocystaceae bacterium]|nr:hypothetical protein [Nannocystaceae bacterium]
MPILPDVVPRWSLATSLALVACRADATPTPAEGSDPPADAAVVDAEPAAPAAPAPAPAKTG